MVKKLNIELYTDIYFLHSLQILRYFSLNPVVRAQIFIRKGPGHFGGIAEVFQLIKTQSNLLRNGGKIFSLKEGDKYNSEETVMLIEGLAQDVIPLETVILGILSFCTTQLSDSKEINLHEITQRVKEIVSLVSDRPVYYFGARHWHYSEDKDISEAVLIGGAANASTAIGAGVFGKKAVGTIPHSLENIFAWKYGKKLAVVESAKAFDKVINSIVPRIALVDYANREIDDSLNVAKTLGNKLFGIRVDTSGENIMQGAKISGKETNNYWYGTGVTISGIHALRKSLNKAGYKKIKIGLSSGFGNPDKVKAFVKAEQKLGMRLFDYIGVGNLYGSRIATMDIVGVGKNYNTIMPFAKAGRSYKANPRLKKMIT